MAEMYFREGQLFQVMGFQGDETAAAPFEISTQPGDTFTVWYKWMELDSSGNVTDIVYVDGETLFFGEAPFEWEQVYAPDGDYLVGFLVSDLDGNMTQSYAKVHVE